MKNGRCDKATDIEIACRIQPSLKRMACFVAGMMIGEEHAVA
jgi:hypothetical protein